MASVTGLIRLPFLFLLGLVPFEPCDAFRKQGEKQVHANSDVHHSSSDSNFTLLLLRDEELFLLDLSGAPMKEGFS